MGCPHQSPFWLVLIMWFCLRYRVCSHEISMILWTVTNTRPG